MWRFRTIILLMLISVGAAAAQVPYVPAEFLDTRIRLQGDSVTTCIFAGRDTTSFDRAAAELIADALLVTHDIIDIPAAEFPIYGEEDFYYDVYQRLVNDCDLIAGISLDTFTLPDWLTVTMPYSTVPFVVVTAQPDYSSLADIPRDQAIGVQIGSLADMNFLAWSLNTPPDQRWQRLPYGDEDLMLSRLQDGTLAAAIIWLPNLLDHPAWQAGELQVIASAPIQETVVETGFLALGNRNWLVGQVDGAIAALESGGVLQDLAAAHGLQLPDND